MVTAFQNWKKVVSENSGVYLSYVIYLASTWCVPLLRNESANEFCTVSSTRLLCPIAAARLKCKLM